MYYVYIYTNPLVTINGQFEHEPFYVGKGKKFRYLHVIKKTRKNVRDGKCNLLRKIIKVTGLSYEEYAKSYIKIIEFKSEDEAYEVERILIKSIGTIREVFGVNKRGSLYNKIEGGKSNPILFGKNNPMYGVSLYEAFSNKYGDMAEKKIDEWKKSVNKGKLAYYKSLLNDEYEYNKLKNMRKRTCFYNKSSEEEINKFLEKISGENHWIFKLSDEKKAEYLQKRRDNHFTKKISKEKLNEYKLKISGENCWWNRLSDEEKKVYRDNNWMNKMSDEEKKAYIDNHPYIVGLRDKTSEVYRKHCEKIKGDNNWMRKISPEEKKAYIDRHSYISKLRDKTSAEYEKLSERMKGENNPNYGKGYRQSYNKNGRAKKILVITPEGEHIYCHGTYKKFCAEVLFKLKPKPNRMNKEAREKLGWFISEVDNIPENSKQFI